MLTISTFNCENLFSRPLILRAGDGTAAELSAAFAELQITLAKQHYGPQDKHRIVALIDGPLASFIELRELRSGLIGVDEHGQREVVASGRASWVGVVELRRELVPVGQQLYTARVIAEGDADIQCVVEVESRRVLEEFNASLAKPYPFHMLIDGNDDRDIDVGILSRHPFASIQTHIFDKGGNVRGDRIFSRDCLEVAITLPDGRPIHVLVNHLKSKRGPAGADEGAPLRTIQAKHLASILGKYDLKRELVVVAGDLNDTPDSAALAPLLAVPGLVSLVDEISSPANRWTYHHEVFGRSQIDYILVSRPLRDAFAGIDVDRRGIFGIEPTNAAGAPVEPFSGLTRTTQASDHAAVIARFNLG